jgi:hypothetical protein
MIPATTDEINASVNSAISTSVRNKKGIDLPSAGSTPSVARTTENIDHALSVSQIAWSCQPC